MAARAPGSLVVRRERAQRPPEDRGRGAAMPAGSPGTEASPGGPPPASARAAAAVAPAAGVGGQSSPTNATVDQVADGQAAEEVRGEASPALVDGSRRAQIAQHLWKVRHVASLPTDDALARFWLLPPVSLPRATLTRAPARVRASRRS